MSCMIKHVRIEQFGRVLIKLETKGHKLYPDPCSKVTTLGHSCHHLLVNLSSDDLVLLQGSCNKGVRRISFQGGG